MSQNTPIPIETHPRADQLAHATLAGGCFWCLEPVFAELKGVIDVECGYTGSAYQPATYEHICSGKTGLAEVVHILYDPSAVNYDDLMRVFFVMHDPTTLNRQGNDIGTQYRSAIFAHDEAQMQVAREMKSWVSGVLNQAVVTEIAEFVAEEYTRAEEIHQDYFTHHPENGYCQMSIPNKLAKLRGNFVGWLK